MPRASRKNNKTYSSIMIQLKFERENAELKLDSIERKMTKYLMRLSSYEDEYIRNKWDSYCEESNYEFNGEEKNNLFDKIQSETDKWKNTVNDGLTGLNIVNDKLIGLNNIDNEMLKLLVKCCSKLRRLNSRKKELTVLINKLDKQILLLSEYEDIYSTTI